MGVQIQPSVTRSQYDALASEGFEPASMGYSSWVTTMAFFGLCAMPGDEAEGECAPSVLLDNADEALSKASECPPVQFPGGQLINVAAMRVKEVIAVARLADVLETDVVWG
jgi:hypothetical protein